MIAAILRWLAPHIEPGRNAAMREMLAKAEPPRKNLDAETQLERETA